MNYQRAEPLVESDGSSLDLIEIFHTLQGEGPFSGQAAVFIRLAGCNLTCKDCDTQYTEGRQRYPIEKVIEYTLKRFDRHPKTTLVVITGGEPTRQNLDVLLEALLEKGIRVQIESNGVLTPSEQFIGFATG